MNVRGRVTGRERFVGLLRALSESAKTGALVVADGGIERRLFFEEGAIVAATSTAPGESFGHLLVERAIIHEQTLQNAERLHGESPGLLGRKLVDLGVMSEEEVQLALRLKVKKTILDILSCPDGQFEFVDERLPDKRKVPVRLDAMQLLSSDTELLEHVRRTAPKGRSVHSPAVSHRNLRAIALLAAGVLLGSLALLSAGYWLFHENTNREEQHRSEDTSTPPDDANHKSGRDVPAVGKEKEAVPAPDSARSTFRETPEMPSSTAAQQRPVTARTGASEPPPAARASADVGLKAGLARRVVDKDSSSASTQAGPAVGTERPASPSAGEQAALPEGKANQPAPGEDAPKNAVVAVTPPSEPPARLGELVEPGPDVMDPVLLEHPKLKYPGEAKRRKVQAVVRVRVLVDEQGTVLEARVEQPVGYGLDEAAVEVALKARFIPATKGGVFVKTWTVLPLFYRLKK